MTRMTLNWMLKSKSKWKWKNREKKSQKKREKRKDKIENINDYFNQFILLFFHSLNIYFIEE